MCAAQNPPIRGLEHIPKSYPRHRKNPALKRSPGFFRHHFGILGYALRELCFLILRAENKKLKRKKEKNKKIKKPKKAGRSTSAQLFVGMKLGR
ncbi:MAG: hypothetical protein LBC41_17740, partial [Clostridiales bacterium]|nr:hypothetical protein [Clostridiales bacterium]